MDRLLDLRDIEAFLAVADEGSFTAAARRLGTNQPTISTRIASLEATLSARLFDRGARQSPLTPVGRTVLPRARGLLRDSDALFTTVEKFFGDPRGLIEVGASTVPASFVLPAALNELNQRLPRIRVRVSIADSDEILSGMREDRLELAVVGRKVDSDEFESWRVGTDQIVLVASPSFLELHPMTLPEDLATVPLILREPGSATRRTALATLESANVKIADVQSMIEVQGNEAMRQSARVGLGVAFLSRHMVADDLANGSLVELPFLQGAERPLMLVVRRGRTLSPASETLAVLLREAADVT